MIRNYLKIAFRNISKHKLHSFINIFGLAVGLTATFLIFSYVRHELSYDHFHRDADHIYRFIQKLSREGESGSNYPININAVGPEVKEQFPQVQNFVRIKTGGETYVEHEKERYTGISMVYADSSFFTLFDYGLTVGDPRQVLTDPKGAVISRRLAEKMFSNQDPRGEMIRVAQEEYRVTGVMEEFPATSHIQYEMVLALEGMPLFGQMGSLEYPTYIRISPESDSPELRKDIAGLSSRLIGERFMNSGYNVESKLQRLTDIHLRSGMLQHDYGTGGDIRHVYMYLFLALLILVVAVINYLNLFTARAGYRTKEVGLRKVVGASRRELIKQFLGESLLTTLLAFVIALAAVELLIDDFGHLLGRDLSTGFFSHPGQFFIVLGITVVVGVLAGYYPAFYLSKYNVIRIFRGGQASGKGKGTFTVSLVVAQFAIAIFLISAVIIFNRQIGFMKNQNLGFNKDHVLVVRGLTEPLKNNYPVIEEELKANPNIQHVTSSQTVPGMMGRSGQSVWKLGTHRSSGIAIKENRVNFGYVETMGLHLKEGRSFSKEYGSESESFIINEKAAEKLGLEDPVGQRLDMGFLQGTIIGVVEDYHFASLKYQVEPVLLTNYQQTRNKSHVAMRIQPSDMRETIDYVENTLQQVDGDYALNYFFLDNQFNRLYQEEERSSTLVGFATLLAIIIAFLGLFALTSFSIMKRTREIGIRKAMGASHNSILRLFTLGMLKWIGVASLIAFPLILYFMNSWLNDFSSRIEIQPWMLLISAIGAALVALMTTSTLTLRAASVNPADTLRDE